MRDMIARVTPGTTNQDRRLNPTFRSICGRCGHVSQREGALHHGETEDGGYCDGRNL